MLVLPILSYAGGQTAPMRANSKAELRDHAGIARAVSQGKGSGMSRKAAPATAAATNSAPSPAGLRPIGPTGNDTAFAK